MPMRILDEKENYLLLTDGAHYAVVEQRAGKYYGLHNGHRRGVAPDDAGVAKILNEEGTSSEPRARHLLSEVATQWRDLFECVR